MNIVISNDASGYPLKDAIVSALTADGHTVIDLGTKSANEFLPHVDAGKRVAEMIQSGKAEKGILLCGTGMGVALTANKYKGVYAAVCESVFSAQRARYINDCNILCMGAFIIAPAMAVAMAKAFMGAGFGEAEFAAEQTKAFLRMQYDAIADVENANFK